MHQWLPLIVILSVACNPYQRWPEDNEVFPWDYTPQSDLEDYEEVRWETEDWDPFEDFEKAGLYLLKANYHRPGAVEEEIYHYGVMRPKLPPLTSEGVKLSFVGDAMYLGGNWDSFADDVADMLDGDLRIGNLETPTSPNHPTSLAELRDYGPYSFNAPPEFLDGLPLDILQVNNNHSLDMGDEGLEATLDEITSRNIIHTGVDQHVIVTVDSQNIAFLSFTWGLNEREVESEHELFVVPFGHLDEDIDLSPIENQIDAARLAGAHTIVVMVHWGFEYEYYPDPHFMVLAREIVAMGADLIVGQGPHVLQPPEICTVNFPNTLPGVGNCSVHTDDEEPRLAAILYSLGNFGTTMPTLQAQVGLIATLTVNPYVTSMGWEAVASVAEGTGQRLYPLKDLLDDEDYAAEAARLDQHLGTSWKR
ncbi:MAG: CapA family protein [Proteobacteria bacterium]|jgi:hypothetical protein|nr:CapA family protein [Pseudomonadota bacterium]